VRRTEDAPRAGYIDDRGDALPRTQPWVGVTSNRRSHALKRMPPPWSLGLPPLRPNRQSEPERRPLAHPALDPDPPPVKLHELLGQRQPEPRALLLAGVVAANLAELLKDRRLIFGGDPDPRVADRDRDDTLRCRGGDADPAPLRGELHRVRQEVQQDL